MEKLDIFDFENEEFEAQKLMRIDLPNLINKIVRLSLPTGNHARIADFVEKNLKRITTAEIESSINSFYKMNDLERMKEK
ncbi:hypothetical protein LIP36_10280 [Amedibacillus dolichus]|uniref:hypothetical protein n=1 Tax=Amedibacillus dolichus TaxID=31971 RepID=UPI001D0288D4|nr:hypothetical protein [Amedibacillus dolichus]MCB5373985.1 hypothetical protein [Amedibacillus dolichus]